VRPPRRSDAVLVIAGGLWKQQGDSPNIDSIAAARGRSAVRSPSVTACSTFSLYDVVHLSRQPQLPDGASVAEILAAKCAARGIPEPSYESIRNSPMAADLEAEWASMLAHQVKTA
jgi:hypothetical protein